MIGLEESRMLLIFRYLSDVLEAFGFVLIFLSWYVYFIGPKI